MSEANVVYETINKTHSAISRALRVSASTVQTVAQEQGGESGFPAVGFTDCSGIPKETTSGG